MENYKTLKTYNNSVEANLAKNYLIENGIDAILVDEYAGEIFSNVVQGIKLNILLEDFTRAEELLAALPAEVSEYRDDAEKDPVIEILEESAALCDGHFRLTSGLHSDRYIEKIKIIQQPDKVVKLSEMLIEKMSDLNPDIIVGLAMGGIALGYEVARQMGKQFIFSQRKDGKITIRSGFKLEKGSKAIIIEDIVTTGGSVKEVIDLLKDLGVDILAVGLLVDRSGGKVDFQIRTETLLELNIKSYQPEECPLCKEGIPLTVPGSTDKK